MSDAVTAELARHVASSTGLPPATAARVVADVVAYFGETAQDFVRRRHRELQRHQYKNDRIWSEITVELGQRVFAAPEFTQRQLRRIVYG